MKILKILFANSEQDEKNSLRRIIKSIIFFSLIGTLVFSPSFANGFVFSIPIIISNSGLSTVPMVAVDNQGNINIIWLDHLNCPNCRNIFFSRSTDNGKTFSSPVNVSQSERVLGHHTMAVDGQGNIYIAWYNDPETPGRRDIYFSRSMDGGQNFTTLNLSNTTGDSVDPDMAVDEQGNINIVWRDYTPYDYPTILFCRSTDFGNSFSVPTPLLPPTYVGHAPEIAVDHNGNIYVTWIDSRTYGNAEILFCYSEDGINFSSPVNVSNTPNDSTFWAPSQFRSHLDVDGMGNIAIIWEECTSGNCGYPSDYRDLDIFFSSSSDGVNFSSPVNVSNDSTRSAYSNLAMDSFGNINVVWQDFNYIDSSSNTEILFSRSIDHGQNFSTPMILSAETGYSYSTGSAQLGVDDQGNISVAWYDNSITGGIWDIYFTHSTDGINFSAPLNVSNHESGTGAGDNSLFVSDQGNIYISWHKRGGETGNIYDIFFIKMLTPEEQIDDLISQVDELLGDGNPLTGILTGAKNSLIGGDNPGTCNILQNAFIPQVDILIRRGEISEEDGQELIDAVNALINELCVQ